MMNYPTAFLNSPCPVLVQCPARKRRILFPEPTTRVYCANGMLLTHYFPATRPSPAFLFADQSVLSILTYSLLGRCAEVRDPTWVLLKRQHPCSLFGRQNARILPEETF